MRPEVLVVIVNYRVASLTVDCLSSIHEELTDSVKISVLVIDNDSRDGSDHTIASAIAARGWSGWATLECAPCNIGFAAGNNLGIRRGVEKLGHLPNYVLLLNPDTLIRPGAIRELVGFMESRSDVGLAGGRSEDPDATPQHCCFRFPNAWNELAANARFGPIDRLLKNVICRVPISDEAHAIDWVSGAFLIIRREVIEDIGLMDESYFLYYEETDYLRRARDRGWTCWHVPQARVVHLVGHSSGVTVRERRPGRKPKYWFDSRRRYFLKHHGFVYTAVADALFIVGVMLGRVRELITFRASMFPPHFLWDTIRHSVLFRGARIERSRGEAWNTAGSETAGSKLASSPSAAG